MATIQSIWYKFLLFAFMLGHYSAGNLLAQGSNRTALLQVAFSQLGVQEATGNNDGKAVARYLNYTGLGEGNEWCAAFVSWCYGQAGYPLPRNAWSPALFPRAKSLNPNVALPADVFGIWYPEKKRIAHVGLLKERQQDYWISIEGNSNNAVEQRRRHIRTIYRAADWLRGQR